MAEEKEVDTRKKGNPPPVPKCDTCKKPFTKCKCTDNELDK